MLIPNVSNTIQTPQSVRVPGDGAAVAKDSVKVRPSVAQAEPQQPSNVQLKSAVDSINRALQQTNMKMELSIDSSTKKPVVKMMDAETGELIRQFPSEEVLAIASSIDQFLEFQQGLLLKTKA